MKKMNLIFAILIASIPALAQEPMHLIVLEKEPNARVLSIVRNEKTKSELGVVDVNGVTRKVPAGETIKELSTEMVLELRWTYFDSEGNAVIHRIGEPFEYQVLKNLLNVSSDGQAQYIEQSLIKGTSGTPDNPVLKTEYAPKIEAMGYMGSTSKIFYAYGAPGVYFSYKRYNPNERETVKEVSDAEFRQLLQIANLKSKKNPAGTPVIWLNRPDSEK